MVVGRDSRVSGPWMRAVAHGVLIAMGYEVVDLGIVTTPTVQVRRAAPCIHLTCAG